MPKLERPQKNKDAEKLVTTLEISGIPAALAAMRADLSKVIRKEAARGWHDSEQTVIDQAVRQSLLRIADIFEAGLTSDGDLT